MTATSIANALLPALQAQGFCGVIHGAPTPNGYGHKITLFEATGPALGTLVLYTGKKGPRYTTNELTSCEPRVLARIATAWSTADFGALKTLCAEPNEDQQHSDRNRQGIQLWVDGTCTPGPAGMRFGWAYVILDGVQEIARRSGNQVDARAITMRNVAAETQAVIAGVDQCIALGYSSVTVCYDYEGLAAWPTGQWQTKTEYTSFYATYVRDAPIDIHWKKVTAHTGIAMNELVDRLASEAAQLTAA